MPRHEHSFMQMHLLDTASEAAAPAAATAATSSGDASEQELREHGEGQPQRAKRERLQSLDALRGLNVIVMMFVDDTWIDSLDHAGWDGAYHLADFVMPTFLLMVGASMSFSMRKYGGPGLKWKVLSRTAKLFVIGCLTQGANPLDNKGIDLHNMRIMGILQRIAWAYCIVGMMKIYLPVRVASGDFLPPSVGKWVDVPGDKLMIFKHYALHWVVALSFVLFYVCVMLFAHVPSWEYTSRLEGWAMDDGELDQDCETEGNKTLGTFVQVCTTHWKKEKIYPIECDTWGDLSPKCSAARMVDEWALGWNHMYDEGTEGYRDCNVDADDWDEVKKTLPSGKKPHWCGARFEPEGLLSSVPTVMTTWLGLHFGLVLTHYTEPERRLKHWVALSTVLFTLGLFISIFWGINKALWSPSYTFFMAGVGGYLLTLFYTIYDLQLGEDEASTPVWQRGLRIVFQPARWVGLNTMFIYLMGPSGGVFYGLQNWIYFNGDTETTPRELFYQYAFCQHQHKVCSPDDASDCVKLCYGYGIFNGAEKNTAKHCFLVFRIAFWVGVAGLLHWRKWYWAL